MRNFLRKVRQKWTYSFVGLWTAIKEEKSIWAYLVIAIALVGLGIWVDLSTAQWSIVMISIFSLIAIEVINTAVEGAVDAISFQYNVKVKKIKDIASGGTLVMTIGVTIAVLLIFIPEIIDKV